jgi:hypothetical protein
VRTELKALPRTSAEWIDEIAAAFEDAREALPFTPLVGVKARPNDLFHLAPHVAIKFRGLPESKRPVAVEAALSTYVGNEGRPSLTEPRLAFALCYLASHFGLDLVSEEMVNKVMDDLMAQDDGCTSGAPPSGRRRGLPNNQMQRTRSASVRRRGPRR